MLIKRRTFLRTGSLASASLFIPQILKSMDGTPIVPPGNKVLVVLQLNGGNDGLNTIIPYRNDIYYASRPGIAIRRSNSLALTDEAGLHPSLTAFKNFYDEGNLAIINNVGYPSPDRSHFRSMDIWQTASQPEEYLHTGWLGRYLDEKCHECEHPTQVIELDDMLSLALKGKNGNGIAMKDPARLFRSGRNPLYTDLLNNHAHEHACETARYLYKTLASTMSSAAYIFENSKQSPRADGYPATGTGRNFKTIASLILSDINTRVYYLSIGSFDTHVGQEMQQRRLFVELNEAIGAFFSELKKNNRMEDVLLVSFSEFGRRVAQNASGGTDHGTANSMFLIGGSLKQKGIINSLPDLTNLDNGDLRYKVDFRQVYATVLNKWLNTPHERILNGNFQLLDFI